ncbi:hypothetical protein CICLE_v10023169mg [Citrus x clementina]|uniref:Uncharacterized protein n=1 Tax=Citrus clementina TaxID=85681 RepID=V4TX45_CITCL|nr:hypothetical protein CICLE_v10023169mg [Citrus x clementina]
MTDDKDSQTENKGNCITKQNLDVNSVIKSNCYAASSETGTNLNSVKKSYCNAASRETRTNVLTLPLQHVSLKTRS